MSSFSPYVLRTRATAAVVAAVAALLSVQSAAGADEVSSAPVTVDDYVETPGIPPAGRYTAPIYPLANDSDPTGARLRLCGVTLPEGVPLQVYVGYRHPEEERYLEVFSSRNESATYEVTYLACNDQDSSEGTMHVRVVRIDPVEARKLPNGRVRFTNPGERGVIVQFGEPRRDHHDEELHVPGGTSVVAQAHRPAIGYSAFSSASFAGEGIIRGLDVADHDDVAKVTATKDAERGLIQFTNPSDVRMWVRYGPRGWAKRRSDGSVHLAPGASEQVEAVRRVTAYRAVTSYRYPGGHGVVRMAAAPSR